jgi:hypothetical protein
MSLDGLKGTDAPEAAELTGRYSLQRGKVTDWAATSSSCRWLNMP